ncbi:MAG: TonB family protein [Pseudomonadota bacterium]
MRRALAWIVPGFLSIALNLLFFSLMPLMTDTDQHIQEKTIPLAMVNVVRIAPSDPEPPPPKKETPKQPDRKPQDHGPEKSPSLRPNIPETQALPFEVNPRLPAVPGIPALAMGTLNMAPPKFKSAYSADEIDKSLTPLAHVPPLYPFNAKRRGIQGWVKVKFLVNTQGLVDTITIEEAEPKEIFDKSVMTAVSQWRFSPGTVEGVPVNTWVTTTIRFELKD